MCLRRFRIRRRQRSQAGRLFLVIEASAQLGKWDHRVLTVRRTFLEAIVPGLYMWDGRSFDLQPEIAKQ